VTFENTHTDMSSEVEDHFLELLVVSQLRKPLSALLQEGCIVKATTRDAQWYVVRPSGGDFWRTVCTSDWTPPEVVEVYDAAARAARFPSAPPPYTERAHPPPLYDTKFI
jgi:hypothetical protein